MAPTLLLRNTNAPAGRVSYLGEDVFYANFSVTSPELVVFLNISVWLSQFSFSRYKYDSTSRSKYTGVS